jgi:hypothetical protein
MHQKLGKLNVDSKKDNIEKSFDDISPLSGANFISPEVPRSMSEVLTR